MAESAIPPATRQAFVETAYHVFAPARFALRIGERSEALDALQRAHGVAASAFVTACNPCSQDLGAAANAPRMAALRAELRVAGVPFLDGEGVHPSNGWPPEPSLLALGLSRDAARALGERHGQDAIVWCGADAVPQIELLR
jgi:hypothetical protein